MAEPLLGDRFEEAFLMAKQLHASQTRKGSGIPYLAHLLAVTALVLEDGGDEDQAIAALLHDAVEDQGGYDLLETIRQRFGDRVADIVAGLTDAYVRPKPPWRERKEGYISHLRQASEEVIRVSLADKLHNARSIRRDLILEGNDLWDRFRGGKEGTLWYYRTLLDVYREASPSPLVAELEQVLNDVEIRAQLD